jgi:effector-binding domain-containing protein
MTRKKYLILFILFFTPTLLWYLFIKKSDYVITFKAKTATGVVFQGVKDWANELKKSEKITYTVINKNNFDHLDLEVIKSNQKTFYYWDFESINDSTTAVTVGIKEEGNSIYNKLTAPFFPTSFKKSEVSKITQFKENLNEHLKAFKVKIDGEGTSEEAFVAYVEMKNVLQQKAQNFIMDNGTFMAYFTKNNIKIKGKPFCDVKKWDLDKEELVFDYCFPIDKNTPYVQDSSVKFKTIPAKKGLKATYFGNMRTSDRAWFALMDYAKKRNIKLSNKPLEHFFANPFNGGNELEWETQIIIPFQ